MELKTKYLSLATKKAIVEQVINNSIVYDGDLLTIDFIQKEVALTISLIQFYINEDIDNIDLDEFYESGKVDELMTLIPYSELSFIEKAIEYTINEKKSVVNSLSGVLSKGINKLIDKIPDEKDIPKMLKQLNKLDANNPIVKSIIETMNGVKN